VSPVPASSRSALRFFLPSVADIVFLVLLISLSAGAVSTRLLNDGYTGWHIRNGELIQASRAIPRTDPFSSTMGGQRWFAWEWLYDAALGLVHNLSGLNGVVFVTALAIAAVFFWVLIFLRSQGTDVAVGVVFLVPAILASSVHFLARPHVVGWLLAVIWLALLERAGDRRGLLLLPLLMVLWVNVHGSFVLGLAMLGIYTLSAAYWYYGAQGDRSSARRRFRDLGAALLACAAASLVNPYGYKLHVHVYRYLTNRFLMDHVQEFQSPDLHSAAGKSFLLLLILSAFAMAAGLRRAKLEHVLLAVFSAGVGLYAWRGMPVASLWLAMVAAPRMSEYLRKRWGTASPASRGGRAHAFSGRMTAVDGGLTAHLWPALAVVIGLWACLHGGQVAGRPILHAGFDPARFPVAAVQVLADRHVEASVLSTDAWGGYLIYRLYPQLKVMVDDRHDLYGESFMRDYTVLFRAAPGWDAILDRWNAGWVLLPPDSGLAAVLKERPAWHIEHDDGHAILFHRD
jgi:hypothetical protein